MKDFKSISLYNNQLTRIDPTTFNGLTYLLSISLGKNRISTLDNRAFTGLPEVKIPLIPNNNLHDLCLGDCPLECDSST
jgi:hypothetical protein